MTTPTAPRAGEPDNECQFCGKWASGEIGIGQRPVCLECAPKVWDWPDEERLG